MNAGATFKTGEATLENREKSVRYKLVYSLGILQHMKFATYNSKIKTFNQDVEMNLKFMNIRVNEIRVISNSSGLVFVSSPHSSEGYLFNFDFDDDCRGMCYTVRRLEGINNEHFLSNRGVFSRKGKSKVFFHYFTGENMNNPILMYSLKINFKKAYISLKSKQKRPGVSNITIKALNMYQINNINKRHKETNINKSITIKVEKKQRLSGVSIKVKKKFEVEKVSELAQFQLNLLDYFTITGQGIDIGYSPNINSHRSNHY